MYRTKLQSLQHILKQYIAGRLGATKGTGGGCVYRAADPETGFVRNCAVGCLFNAAQMKDILARGVNESGLLTMSEKVGKKNIETVTGMTLKELATLQREHDQSRMSWVQAGDTRTDFYIFLKKAIEVAAA